MAGKNIYTGNMLESMEAKINDLQSDIGTMSANMANMVASMTEMINISSLSIESLRVVADDSNVAMIATVHNTADQFKSVASGSCKLALKEDIDVSIIVHNTHETVSIVGQWKAQLGVTLNGVRTVLAEVSSEAISIAGNGYHTFELVMLGGTLSPLLSLAEDDILTFDLVYPAIQAGQYAQIVFVSAIPDTSSCNIDVNVYAKAKPQIPEYMLLDI